MNHNNNNNYIIDENLRQLFNFWDTDRSGYLSRDEMRELCARFSISVDESDAIFGDLDRDKDGRVSYEDFQTGFDDYEKGLIVSTLDSTNTSESYGSLKKALETENISEKIAKNELTQNSLNKSINTSVNGFSEQYISEPTHDSQQSAQTVIQELLESVRELQEENKRLADSWMREKKEHEKHLSQLEEEVDSQVKEVEHRVKQKAKEEVEAERKSMRELMKGEMEELQSHLSMFEKVDSWLKSNPNNLNEEKVNEIRTKLEESMQESRQLKMSLMDTQTNVALMRTELAQLRVQYEDKCRELSSEMGRVTQQQTEQQQLQRQLLLLQDANKRLHDTNDQLRTVMELTPIPSRNGSPVGGVIDNNNGTKQSTSHLKRGSLIGSYMRTDSVGSYDYSRKNTFDRLTEVDLSSISTGDDEVYSVSNQSFASCPPITTIKSIANNEDVDSGLSSLKTRSAHSSPVLTNYNKRPQSPKKITDSIIRRNYETNIVSHSISKMISEATGPPERTYKIIFIGDASVGKSTFILRLTKDVFAPRLSTTLGVDFQVKIFNFDGKNVALQLWDTAGQERYRSITKNYFRKADGIMLLYDVTSEQSFLDVREWITAIEEVTAKGVPVMIVGNKTDLRSALMAQDLKYVKAEEGYKLAQQYGLMFVETSCKDGQNVMSSIAQLTKVMTQNEDSLIESAINLKDTKPKRFGCCTGVSPLNDNHFTNIFSEILSEKALLTCAQTKDRPFFNQLFVQM